jgi:hypothetical protein
MPQRKSLRISKRRLGQKVMIDVRVNRCSLDRIGRELASRATCSARCAALAKLTPVTVS